jgi:sporulation protein YlmC with PRC-barrel domain
MYVLSKQLHQLPIMSLQTGQTSAFVEQPLIFAANLEVMALYCQIEGRGRDRRRILLMRDIRQLAMDCIIIDSDEELTELGDIIRLRDIAKADFTPINKLVVNESGQRLGKVEDYTINLKSHLIQKLYVHQSLMRSILFNSLVIDRTQIIDVTPKQITVRDANVAEPLLSAKPLGQKSKTMAPPAAN